MARCACIDVGSNTTALLVADVTASGLTKVATRRFLTMLGNEVQETGIGEAKIEETAAAVAELAALARESGCDDRIELIATHMLRSAADADELAQRIHERSGIAVEVIDGDTEARFSFIGAVGGLANVRRTTVVIDLGGGSTEIAMAGPGEDPVAWSFTVGSSAIRRRFLVSDPPTEDELARAREYVEEEFASLELPRDHTLALAVGGGAATASQLTGGVIDAGSLARVLALTTRESSAEMAAKYGIEQVRARLVPAGLTVFAALVERLGSGIEVGLGGLREGVLLDRYGS